MAIWLLLFGTALGELVKVSQELEKLIYRNRELDRYNDRTCKHPTPAEYTFLWSDELSGCVKEDRNSYAYSSLVAY